MARVALCAVTTIWLTLVLALGVSATEVPSSPDWADKVMERSAQRRAEWAERVLERAQRRADAPQPPIEPLPKTEQAAWRIAMDPATKQQLVLCLAALLGSAMKAWATNSQATLSKQSFLDIFVGGLAGLLVPIYAAQLIPKDVSLLASAGVMCFIAYSSSDLIQNVMGKIGTRVNPLSLVGTEAEAKAEAPRLLEKALIGKDKTPAVTEVLSKPPLPPPVPAPGLIIGGRVEYPAGWYDLDHNRKWQWTPKPK